MIFNVGILSIEKLGFTFRNENYIRSFYRNPIRFSYCQLVKLSTSQSQFLRIQPYQMLSKNY
jgi:hypothetical protein